MVSVSTSSHGYCPAPQPVITASDRGGGRESCRREAASVDQHKGGYTAYERRDGQERGGVIA